MRAWGSLDRWPARAGAFFAVLALPFLRHLVRVEYPWWRSEVGVLLAVFAAPALVLAAVTRRLRWFLVAFVVWLALASASAADTAWYGQQEWVPPQRWLVAFLGLTTLFAAAAVVVRRRLVVLAVVLLAGMLVSELGLTAVSKVQASSAAAAPEPPSAPPLVIHIVFDGQIGIAGFPPDLPESVAAARAWQDTLVRHGFTVFPRAFSNYEHTRNSLPSILNDRLLSEEGGLVGDDGMMTANGRFAAARTRRLALRIYQSDYLRFAEPDAQTAVREYPASAPAPMPAEVATLGERTEVLAGWYARLDKVSARLLKLVAPTALFSPNQWPLNVRRIWPDTFRAAVHAAARPTYFFAHVLLPHPPFAFDADGRIRTRRLWRHWADPAPTIADHDAVYREYANQSHFAARQLDALLDDFERTGVLARAEVLLHGDHGSRLHAGQDVTESLDGLSASPRHVRGLVDSFSTLLAVRHAGQAAARVDETTGGILRLLRRVEGRPEGPEGDALDRVYRFQPGRRDPSSAAMRDYWRD